MKIDMLALIDNIKTFRLKSFFVRNLLITMLVVLVPVAVIGIAFCATIQRSADKEINQIADSNLIATKKTVDMMLRTADMFAIQTGFEQNINTFLYAAYRPNTVSSVQADIRKYISSFINVHSYIHSVYIYSEKTGLIVYNNEISDLKAFKDQTWMPFYHALPTVGKSIVARRYNGRYPAFISIIRSVGVEEGEKTGCVVVNIDVEKMNESIRESGDQQAYYFLVDSQNTIYLSHNVKLVAQQYDDMSTLLCKETGLRENEGGRRHDYIFSETVSQWYDLRYISVTPNEYFGEMVQHSVHYMLVMILLLFLSVIAITLLISFRTYAPIQSLLSILTPQELNNAADKPYNEINCITENIKQSIVQNKKLEEELNYRLLLLNKAQLYALQTQINPHFMNNMLDTISWMAVSKMGPANKVSKMLRSLSGLLRISLDSEHYLIPIEEELQHANIYTYIMSENYGDDLNFVWDIDESLHECRMLKLTLQPVLENAIEHGIKPKRGVGEIKIFGRADGDIIHLTIEDNGVGMPEAKLEELRCNLRDSRELSGQHIGIKNVNQRIKLVFGEEYGISLDSCEGKGTSVHIVIPKLYFKS